MAIRHIFQTFGVWSALLLCISAGSTSEWQFSTRVRIASVDTPMRLPQTGRKWTSAFFKKFVRGRCRTIAAGAARKCVAALDHGGE
jgi:hypothetical protein